VLRDLPTSNPASAIFSPDGRWLATSGDGNRLYEAGSWESRFKLTVSPDFASGVSVVAFSPDGEIWAIANPPHNTHLYATSTGQRLAVLEPLNQAMPVGLTFSPDGTTLSVLQRDGVVQLWDLRQIRHQLVALNLDWDQPAYSPAPVQAETRFSRVEIGEDPVVSARRTFLASKIPPRPRDARARMIDLSPYYNAALTEQWHEAVAGNDLSELRPGFKQLAGILFDVRGLVQVGGGSHDGTEYPTEVSRIRVNQVCVRLHFLHSAISAEGTPVGVGIGTYLIHYADSRQASIPIVMGKDLMDWLSQPQENLADVVIAWTGGNERSRETGQRIRLFKTTWTNPFPSVPITRIDLITYPADHVDAKPFLVAITAE